MKIGIIGAGKVANNISQALKLKGYQFCFVSSKTETSAEQLSKILDTEVGSVCDCAEHADIIFITTPDDCISDIARDISSYLTEKCASSFALKDKIFIHMSGLKTSDAMKDLKKFGANLVSLHPVQTFASKETADVLDFLKNTLYTFEGDAKAFELCGRLVDDLGGTMIEIKACDKPKYHVALCVASNYLVTLLDEAVSMLCDVGFDKKEALSAIKPLVSVTLKNCLDKSPEKSLTGPISRGDVETIKTHLQYVEDRKTYSALGTKTVRLAFDNGYIDEEKYGDISNLLKEAENG